MPYWREHSSIACPQCQGGGPTAPRSLSEQTDAIMRHLVSARNNLAVGNAPRSGTVGRPTWPEPLFDPNEGTPDWPSPTPKAEPQSFQRVASPAMLLQLGARGLDALRTLGPAAAAALAAIIKSYQDQLGRPPSPAELDRALSEQAQHQVKPGAPPASAYDVNRRRKPDFEEACEKLYDDDTLICNQVTQTLGKQTGAVCHRSAATRYSECLAYGGPGKVRTPLTIPDYYYRSQ